MDIDSVDSDDEHIEEELNDDNRLSDDSDHPMTDDDDNSGTEADEDSEADENQNGTDEDVGKGNAGWAKSLARILRQEKPKNRKNLILSQAKKTVEIEQEIALVKSIGFQIEGEIKEEKPDPVALNAFIEEKKVKKIKVLSLRIKPTMMDRERERAFKKIATKGVVQLFNAVRIQQKDLSHKLDEAGKLDHKRDAVLNNINKKKFLDVLMGGARAKSENVDNPVKDEVKDEDDEESDYDDAVYNDGLPKNSIWSVLK